MGNLKYYDGMGTEVTAYVDGLEQKIKALEKQLDTATRKAKKIEASTEKLEIVPAEELATELDDLNSKVTTMVENSNKKKEEGIGKVDLSKTKRKRSKKKVNADPK